MRVSTTWWCLALVAMMACAGPKDGPADTDTVVDTDAPVAPPTVEGVCAEISAALCDALTACGCRFDIRPYSATGCRDARTADCVAGLGGNVGVDLAAGRARFDPPHVRACVDALEQSATTCALDRDGGLPEACDALLVDVAEVGEDCTVTGGGTAYCASGAGVCVPGETTSTCVARPLAGQGCPQGLCAEGLVCGLLSGECAPLGAEGDTCAQGTECGPGLVCGPEATCAEPLPDGATCTSADQCADGRRCDGDICTAAVAVGDGCYDPGECGVGRSCGRAPESRTCGDADTLDATCRDGTCEPGLGCAASTRTCVGLPGVDETCLDGFACDAGLTCADGLAVCMVLPGQGETCATGNRFCEDGLGCDFDTNTCEAGPGDGVPCLLNPPDYVCGDGLGCDFGTNGSLCVPLGGAGSVCATDRTCASGTYCEYSTLLCTTRLADGSPCEDGNECAGGSVCAPGPAGYTCGPIPARGEPCVDTCGDGTTCKGPGGVCVPPICVIP